MSVVKQTKILWGCVLSNLSTDAPCHLDIFHFLFCLALFFFASQWQLLALGKPWIRINLYWFGFTAIGSVLLSIGSKYNVSNRLCLHKFSAIFLDIGISVDMKRVVGVYWGFNTRTEVRGHVLPLTLCPCIFWYASEPTSLTCSLNLE